MKKPIIQLSLFIILTLSLITGLTYVTLDQGTSPEQGVKEPRMSIALINEDDGASFNDQDLDFGNAFVRSIDQDKHDWFVVSRGVAESGLERNTYDMMLIIPNDFTHKALSIDSESPEQVVLNYKINASDSEMVRAQAEEVASSILSDFNRRIIDVYFASVIGNLQDAQDNVSEIVSEYEVLTNSYSSEVNAPLSDYTNQFLNLKDNTTLSINTFEGFESTLDSYQGSLLEQLGSYEDYESTIQGLDEEQESNIILGNNFSDKLSGFQQDFVNPNVDNKLQTLLDTNNYINVEFQSGEQNAQNERENLASHTRILQTLLDNQLQVIEQQQDNFNVEEIHRNTRNRLSEIIGDSFGGDDQLTKLLASQQTNFLKGMEAQIAQLPSLDGDILVDSDLSPEMIRELQNVIAVTKKYNNHFNDVDSVNPNLLLPEHIQALKENLNKNGVTLTDTVILPELEEALREFKITQIPEGFAIKKLSIQLPDMEEINYKDYQVNDEIELPSYQHGEFKISLTLKLNDEYLDQPIDVYEMKKWKWEMYQLEEEAAEEPNKPDETNNDSSSTDENNEENTKKNESDKPSEDEPTQSDTTNNDSSSTDENSEETANENDNTENQEDTQEENADDNNSENEEDTSDKPVFQLVEVNHHYIKHTVRTPMVDNFTEDLIYVIENTIAPYQKLLSTYESYFGFTLTCNNVDGNNCSNVDNEKSLAEMASDDSLYALLNKDVGELLADYLSDQITSDVTEEMREPLTAHEQEIEDHYQYIESTSLQADKLAATVVDTRTTARILNENLELMLNDIAAWREQSLELINDQTEVQNANQQEQTMVMSLSQSYQPLLSESQSLADQASSNLNESETVYQTFNDLDEKADYIHQSGRTLTQEAEDLSQNMTDKLLQDQSFVGNFTNVMANSRTGDRPNEELYDFLSNPVEISNQGVIIETDTFTSYFLVLICFLVALFTGYGLSVINQKRMSENQFDEEKSLMGRNGLTFGITTGIGVLEGLVLGVVSAYLLNITGGNMFQWTVLMVLIMVTMVLVSTYLLKQLKMMGMFILLFVLSMYLFLTNALTSSLSGVGGWRDYSPLQYVERLLNRVVQGSSDLSGIVFSLIVIALLAGLANLLIVNSTSSEVPKEDDHA
ncbi:type VII secretion protein EsaA [Salipaludibacillus sp. HK11]|uniref:type VII secretion protein EsaA n=1 Tax=Salipaludibacillus sp. HK11 TaxID=3394320 RepID=UPI0039FC033F